MRFSKELNFSSFKDSKVNSKINLFFVCKTGAESLLTSDLTPAQ